MIVDAVKNSMPEILTRFLLEKASSSDVNDKDDIPAKTDMPSSTRGDRFFKEENEIVLPQELLDFASRAFSSSLTKEKWQELTSTYPPLKESDTFLVSPTMEAGMKEDIRKQHGYNKTKDVFAFDEGLGERQGAFLVTARPILAALSALENLDDKDEETPDPDTIKGMLEDALVLLGNATFRLNAWRQRRFQPYLTEIGKRTLKEGIPADKHLFPQKFHERIKSEHDHSSTNSKLISRPQADKLRSFNYNKGQPFRGNNNNNNRYSAHGNNNQSGSRKRRWGYGPKQGSSKRPREDMPKSESNRSA